MSRLSKAVALALVALISGCTYIDPLVIASHVSDPSDGGISDTTVDFLGAGATATFGGLTIDGAIGRKALNCNVRESCGSTLGGMLTLRWSPEAPR